MSEGMFLGLDGGGTQTRWALCDAVGSVHASGSLAPVQTLHLTEPQVAQQTLTTLQALTEPLRGVRVTAVVAGMSGIGTSDEPAAQVLRGLLLQSLAPAQPQVLVTSDISVAYAGAFAPGQGYLIYAGTGSVAAFVDAQGQMHRAGGRGGILDDGGSGYWIAREALRHIWRQEDERPGAWVDSPMAVRIFAQLGGSDWAQTRRVVYGGTRGVVGELALAVAAAASDDLVARQILHRAGAELARLGLAMSRRFGAKPMALAGRVSALHPSVLASLREALGSEQVLQVVQTQGHVEAARWAGRTFGKGAT